MKVYLSILAILIHLGIGGMPTYALDEGIETQQKAEEEAWKFIQENVDESKFNFLHLVRKALCSKGEFKDRLENLSQLGVRVEEGDKMLPLEHEQYDLTDRSGHHLRVDVVKTHNIILRTFDEPILNYTYGEGNTGLTESDHCSFVEAKFIRGYEIFEFDEKGHKHRRVTVEPIREVPSAETCSLPKEDFYFDQVYSAAGNQKKVLMAIIDNGFDLNHPALANRLYDRKKVMKERLNIPLERNEHGTKVTGVALKNSRHLQFIPMDESTIGLDGNLRSYAGEEERILNAASSGARVANISWGFRTVYPYPMRIKLEDSKDTLFVTSAGNEGINNDDTPLYPSRFSLDLENVISVGATDQNKKLADFSNFGRETVDVAAPGVDIETTVPCIDKTHCFKKDHPNEDRFSKASGTSFAAPFVSNVAAKILLINSDLTSAQVKKIIMETVDKKPWLKDKIKSGGVVNPDRAYRVALETKALGNNIDVALDFVRSHERFQESIQKGLEPKTENAEAGKKYLPEIVQKLEAILSPTGSESLQFKEVE